MFFVRRSEFFKSLHFRNYQHYYYLLLYQDEFRLQELAFSKEVLRQRAFLQQVEVIKITNKNLGNQPNNGPHQDQIFHNPSAVCLALWDKNRIWLGGGLMHPIGSLWRE